MFLLIACCQELTVSFSGNDTNLLSNYALLELEGTWINSGIIIGIDYYTFQDKKALWFVDGYWIMGRVNEIGTINYSYMYAESLIPAKALGKCPNNQGSIKWNWAYIGTEDPVVSNDINVKCANENDFCTSTNPCGSEQGDCDIHDECKTGLTCGLNNCGIAEDPEMDCCYAATIGDDTFCTTVNNNDLLTVH